MNDIVRTDNHRGGRRSRDERNRAERAIELVLPYPPSANRLWRAGRGHVHLSPAYTQWLDEAGWHVAKQRRGHIRGPYRLGIAALRFDRRKRDLDNLIKPINDLLHRLGVVEDDCLAELISMGHVRPAGNRARRSRGG